MELDVNKIVLNKRLKAFTFKDKVLYSLKKDGKWLVANPNETYNLTTQINFLSSEPYHISDLFILVDRSDSGRFYIYRDIHCSFVSPRSKGIFDNNEYILCDILENESKKIYNKFWELKTRLK
jgi:hypothetical protein